MGLCHDTVLLLDQLVARFLFLLSLHELSIDLEDIVITIAPVLLLISLRYVLAAVLGGNTSVLYR
jgi:hypothetical protein